MKHTRESRNRHILGRSTDFIQMRQDHKSDTTEQLNNNIRKSTFKHIIYLKRKSKTIKTFIRKHKRKSSRQAGFPETGQHKLP